jgi:hypothetical protein
MTCLLRNDQASDYTHAFFVMRPLGGHTEGGHTYYLFEGGGSCFGEFISGKW